MQLAGILEALEVIAPLRFAERWDNVGLIVGNASQDVFNILLCIDYTRAVAKEADGKAVDLVVAYHPPIFEPITRIESDSLVYDAVRKGRGIYSPHTALDVARGGTNDVLADAVGIGERRGLRPREEDRSLGLGRIGKIGRSTRRAVIAHVKRSLSLERVMVAGPLDRDAETVAVAAGSAGDLVKDAAAASADMYVTGEMRHHDALWAAAHGITAVCLLHSASERAVLTHVGVELRKRVTGVDIHTSQHDRDPFQFE